MTIETIGMALQGPGILRFIKLDSNRLNLYISDRLKSEL